MATQAQVQHMVEINVKQNVNQLMQHLEHNPGEYDNEIRNVMSKPDYVEPAADKGIIVKSDMFACWWVILEDEEPDGPYDFETEAWESACANNNIEPYYDEAYEFYIVSNWLALQLKKRGEMVEEIFDLTIWGRCATGQVVWLDGIMIEIYDENEVN